MFLIVTVALIIVLSILSVHYYQHFHCQCRRRRNRSLSSTRNHRSLSNVIEEQMSLIRTTHCEFKCCFHFVPADGQEFDFFPMSFLLYLVFIAILCILIIIIEIEDYSDDINNESTVDFLFGYSSQSYNSFTTFHSNIETTHRSIGINSTTIIDYILVYSTILLFIWVSLFSFYRYYTTFISLTRMQSASMKRLFIKFTMYAIIFCIIILLQIHVYYYLFPIVIILFCAFNWYCTYKFGVMLTASVQLFITVGQDDDLVACNDTNQDMLNSILFAKHISVICCILQSMNLSIFIIAYDVKTLGYLSVLWSISGFILALNFVRTRQCLKYELLRCKQHCKCICYKKVQTRKARPFHVRERPIDTNSEIIADVNIDIQNVETQPMPPPLQPKIYSQSHSARDIHKIKAKPLLLRSNTDPLAVSLYALEEQDETERTETVDTAFDIEQIKSRSHVERDVPVPVQPGIARRSSMFTYVAPKPQLDGIESGIKEEPTMITHKDAKRKTVVTLELPGNILGNNEKTPSISSSVTTTRSQQKALELLGITPTIGITPTPVDHPLYDIEKPSRVTNKQSSSKTPSQKTPSMISELKRQITNTRSRYVNMDSDEDSSTPVPPSPMDVLKSPTAACLDITVTKMQYTPKITPDISGDDYSDVVRRNKCKLKNKTERKTIFKGIPHLNAQNKPIDIDQMFVSLDKLAKCGFCSRNSVTSLKQLEEFQRRLKLNTTLHTM